MPAAGYRNLLERYARYAPNYDRRFARYSQLTLRKSLDLIPEQAEGSLLDVACGTGLFEGLLMRERPRLKLTGVDLSPQMLAQAKSRLNGQIDWHTGRAEELPVESGSFDFVTCNNAFHLVQDAAAALVEFHRVLRGGGRLIIVDWCLDFPLMQMRDATLHLIDRQKRSVRRLRELTGLIETAGFAIEHASRFRASTWGMMAIAAQRKS